MLQYNGNMTIRYDASSHDHRLYGRLHEAIVIQLLTQTRLYQDNLINIYDPARSWKTTILCLRLRTGHTDNAKNTQLFVYE